MALQSAISMVIIPVIIFSDGAQTQEIFRAPLEPAHSRQFTAILHKMAASAFNHARSNRPAIGQVSRVVHESKVAFKIVSSRDELRTLPFADLGLFCQRTKFGNELFGLP